MSFLRLGPMQSEAAGFWWFACLALLAVGALAFVLGRMQLRLKVQSETHGELRRLQQQLEQARTELQRSAATADSTAAASNAADSLRAAAALLLPCLRASDTPLLLAWDQGQGWQLADLNPAASARWPQLLTGTPLAATGELLPAEVLAALDALPAAGAMQLCGGWRLAGTGTLQWGDASRRGAVLARAQEQAQGQAVVAAAEPERLGAEPGYDLAVTDAQAFSFTLSHDLRAPIRVVEGFTRIVKEDYGAGLDRVGNDHLDRVLGAAARMNLMIDALLTVARLSTQPLARQPVNLSQLATFVADELRRSAPERVAEINIEPGLVAQGDPTLLRLVLENLLGNAWKYSARSARAVISMRSVPHAAAFAYEVRDNGAGFDMRGADRLFGLFQRLHSASEFAGHGVGLASVQRIVRRHGGAIWAEAEPGRGAAFFFTLSGR